MNHGKCFNCWWYQPVKNKHYIMTNYGLKQNLGNGKCYMENSDEGYFKRVEGDSYCPDYLNRVRGNKTENMTLEEWIKNHKSMEEYMTREEQKIKASKEYGIGNPIFIWDEYEDVRCDEIRPAVDFAKGIDWADSHPINQWRKAENELPKRIGDDSETVIITDGYFIHLGHYSFIHNTWLTEENYMYKNESIQYWLEIPELPKE